MLPFAPRQGRSDGSDAAEHGFETATTGLAGEMAR